MGSLCLIVLIRKIEIVVPTSFFVGMINEMLPTRPGYLKTLIARSGITAMATTAAAAVVYCCCCYFIIIIIIALVNKTNQSLLSFPEFLLKRYLTSLYKKD